MDTDWFFSTETDRKHFALKLGKTDVQSFRALNLNDPAATLLLLTVMITVIIITSS